MVVIPLTKDASCFYGKGTRWCTAGDEDNRFIEYFYIEKETLFYVFMKESGKKYAVSFNNFTTLRRLAFKYFNELDEKMSKDEFYNKTKIDNNKIKKLYTDNEILIEKARDINNLNEDTKIQIIKEYPLLIRRIDDPSESVQLEAIKNKVEAILKIKKPTQKEIELALDIDKSIEEFLD